jgi:hypothetical protein
MATIAPGRVHGTADSAGARVIRPAGLAYWLSAAWRSWRRRPRCWIAVQLLILQRYLFLQPAMAGIGVAEILLAWRWQATREGEFGE